MILEGFAALIARIERAAERVGRITASQWKRLGIVVLAVSLSVTVASRFVVSHHTLGSQRWLYLEDVGYVGGVVSLLGLWWVAQVKLDTLGVKVVRAIARRLPSRGNGALAIARHTLDSRRPTTLKEFWTSKAEYGSLVLLAMVLCGYVAAFSIDEARVQQAEALQFDAMVVPSAPPAGGYPLGVDQTALGAEVLSALAADPHWAVVPFGRVTLAPTDAETPRATVLVVEPADLDRIVAGGAAPFGFQDGVVLSPEVDVEALRFAAPPRLVDVATGSGDTTVFHRTWFTTSTLATRAWADATWADVPVVGALVMHVGDDTGDGAVDRAAALHELVGPTGAQVLPVPALPDEAVEYRQTSARFFEGTLRLMVLFTAIAASIGVAVEAARNVKRHRQVRATIAALGAPPRALALAVPIDAAVGVIVGFAVGAPLGCVGAAIVKHPTLMVPGAPLDPGTTAWGLWWNLAHIAWGQVALVAGLAAACAVAATAIYGFAVARRTPVDELREAIKAGVS